MPITDLSNIKNVFEYGNEFSNEIYKKIMGLVDNSDTDLHIHENGECWKKNAIGRRVYVGKNIVSAEEIMALGAILATKNETTLNMQNSTLDAFIPFDGARIHIDIPPTTSSPVLDLRIFHDNFKNLGALINNGMIEKEQAEILVKELDRKKNIIIAGETGCGKTTLLQALMNEISPYQHILVIEDTREITRRSPWDDHNPPTSFLTTSQWVNAQRCVSASLRKDPDRIVYGEVRDKTALDLIESWNSGHGGGLGTIHANSAQAALTRLVSLCGQASASSQVRAIREAIDIIVHINIEHMGTSSDPNYSIRRKVDNLFFVKESDFGKD